MFGSKKKNNNVPFDRRMKKKILEGEEIFDIYAKRGSIRKEDIKKLLESKNVQDLMKGLGILSSMAEEGKDISEYKDQILKSLEHEKSKVRKKGLQIILALVTTGQDISFVADKINEFAMSDGQEGALARNIQMMEAY